MHPLRTQRTLLAVILPFHLVLGLLQITSLALHGLPHRTAQATAFAQGELTGRVISSVVVLAWAFFGGAWAAYNLASLRKPNASVRTSLMLYWIYTLLSCCCFPFAIFGLVNLNKPDVAASLRD